MFDCISLPQLVFISLLTLSTGLGDCTLAVAEETIVVRRGETVYDVVISDDISNQVQLWNGLRQKTHQEVIEYTRKGKGRYSRYTNNFLFRYRPEQTYRELIELYEQSDDEAVRMRAAARLNYFMDFRGIDWAIAEIEKTEDPKRLQHLAKVFSQLFLFEARTGTPPRRFDFSPSIGRLLKTNFMNRKFRRKAWVHAIDGESFQPWLQEQIEDPDAGWLGGVPPVDEYSARFPDAWLLEFAVSKINGSETEAQSIRGLYLYGKVFRRLCLSEDQELAGTALHAYQEIILGQKNPLFYCKAALAMGVPFTDAFLQDIRNKVHQSVLLDAKSAIATKEDSQIPGARRGKPTGWGRFETDGLAHLFRGTADAEVIAELRGRWAKKKRANKGAPMASADRNNEDIVFAIAMVSGEKLDDEMLGYLAASPRAIARMEGQCLASDKSHDDLFRLFHKHGFALDQNPDKMNRHFEEQRILTGDSIQGRRELIRPADQVGMFELLRGVYLEQDRWLYLSYEDYLRSFWRMVDATDGEFAPRHFTVIDDKNLGHKMVGFTWKNKSFRFPFRGVTGFIPPLNAILRHEGSKNGFVQIMGSPTGGFLTPSTPKAAFGPVDIFDALESDFGLTVVTR